MLPAPELCLLKSLQAISPTLARCWCLMPIIVATWETEIRRIMVQVQPGQIVHETHISKITRAKWTGDVAVECLLCKHRAMSSNPSPTKKNK
jgi:hypothetical protein